MKLYLISVKENLGYDAYDSAVVAAPSQKAAKSMHPRNGSAIESCNSDSWVHSPDKVTCECVGQAKRGTVKGVICASFNAG